MNQANISNQSLRRHIMLRVWYTFAINICFSVGTLWGIAFGASVIGFWRLVSITSIVQNLLSVQLGSLPAYVWQSLIQAELLALLTFAVIVFTILSVGIKVTVPIVYRRECGAA